MNLEILEKDEKVICELKPDKKIFKKFKLFFPFVIPFCIPPFIILWLVMWIGFLIVNACVDKIYKKQFYIVTDKRVIEKKVFIGVTYKSLYYKDIQASDVKTSYLDRRNSDMSSNTGSILIKTLGSTESDKHCIEMLAIKNPFEISKIISKLVSDRK